MKWRRSHSTRQPQAGRRRAKPVDTAGAESSTQPAGGQTADEHAEKLKRGVDADGALPTGRATISESWKTAPMLMPMTAMALVRYSSPVRSAVNASTAPDRLAA